VWWATLVLMLLSGPLFADDAVVVVATADAESSLAQHLRLELESLGFETATEPMSYPLSPTDIAEIVEDTEVIALVIIPDQPATAEIWTKDLETRKAIRRIVPIAVQHPAYPSQAAVEIAELVRASQLELGATPPPSEEDDLPGEVTSPREGSESPPAADTSSPETTVDEDETIAGRDERYRLELEAAGGAAAGTFEYPPIAYLAVRAHWRFYGPLGVSLMGHVPLTATRAEAAAGAASLRQGIIGLAARLSFETLSRRFRPALEGGAGVAVTRVEGEAVPGWIAKSKSTTAAILFLRLGGAVVLTRRIALTVGALLGTSLPGLSVAIDGEPTLEWGDFVFCGDIGLVLVVI
jgi:hypothetical protein